MNVVTFRNAEQLADAGASLIAGLLQTKPRAVLGLATGSSPVGIYRQLVERYRRGWISFRSASTFNLDEYVGLGREHPNSYYRFMQEQLFGHVDMPADGIRIPDGQAADLEAECRRYDGELERAGAIDLQLLGIGENGHIGFNEPDSALTGGTHVTELRDSTRKANARFFASPDDVPRQAITMGIGSILQASSIVLVAQGAGKADIVRRALRGPIATECPASLLQTHPRLTVLLDEAAAAGLKG